MLTEPAAVWVNTRAGVVGIIIVNNELRTIIKLTWECKEPLTKKNNKKKTKKQCIRAQKTNTIITYRYGIA